MENILHEVWDIPAKMAPIAWPTVIILIAIFFSVPLYRLLNSLAVTLSKATKVKIGDVEWTLSQLDEAIIDREILKTVISMAAADGRFDETETQYLQSLAAPMIANLRNLTSENKERVLQYAINMAAADGEIQSEEYEALKNKAADYNVSIPSLEKMILDECNKRNLRPPPQLLARFEEEYQQNSKG